MKNLSRNQWIAVFAGLGFLGYILFGNSLMDFFNPTNNNLNSTPQTGFVSEDVVVGQGLEVGKGDNVTVHYVGTFQDGRVFDSSLDRNTPFTFTIGVGGVIRGWDEGLLGMKVGGKRLLVIAPDYAYGPQGSGPIPPNSTLLFEVELLDVKKPSSL